MAAERKADYVDQLHPVLDAISAGRADGVLGEHGEPRLMPDGVHPDWSGHLLMATAILRGLGARALVSRLAIDAATMAITEQDHCSGAVSSAPRSRRTRGDRDRRARTAPCPWPIPTACALALQLPGSSPVEALSRYELAVSNLEPGRYRVAIDGELVCEATAEQLAQGSGLSQRFAARSSAQAQRRCSSWCWRRTTSTSTVGARSSCGARPDGWPGSTSTARARRSWRGSVRPSTTPRPRSTPPRAPSAHTVLISCAPPPPPSPLTLGAQGADVVVAWHPVTAAKMGYRIERAAPNQPFMKVAEVGAEQASWTDAGADHALVYRVRALGSRSRRKADPRALPVLGR